MIVVAILGILAAIAIPAFVQQMRRAKSSEAVLNIDRLFEGAVTYFDSPHVVRGATAVEIRAALPQNQTWSPTLPQITAANGGKQIASTHLPSFQANPTWQALSFTMTDNFYYAYQFTSACAGSSCPNNAEAYCQASGDLDADGTMSLFERAGKTVQTASGWVLYGAAAIYANSQTE